MSGRVHSRPPEQMALAALYGVYRRHGLGRFPLPRDRVTRAALERAERFGWCWLPDGRSGFVTPAGVRALEPYGVKPEAVPP